MHDDDSTGLIDLTGIPPMDPPSDRLGYIIVLSGQRAGYNMQVEEGQEILVGRSMESQLHIDEDGVSRKHAIIERREDGTTWVKDLGSTNGLMVNGMRVEEQLLQDGDHIVIGQAILLKYSIRDALEAQILQRQFDAATRDPLTRCHNRRSFDEHINRLWSMTKRHGMPLSIAILDLDHFKSINDTYGHLAGDYVLKEFGQLLMSMMRTEEFVARFGGEEFVIAFTNTAREGAVSAVERIRVSLEHKSFRYNDERIDVTASIGVVTYDGKEHQSIEDLLEYADACLYRAKSEGRNCTRTEPLEEADEAPAGASGGVGGWLRGLFGRPKR